MRMLSILSCVLFATVAPGQEILESRGFVPLPEEVKMGAMSAVALDAKDRLFILHRGEPPLLMFDSNGKYLRGVGTGMFKVPHGLRIDSAGNVWTTDNGNHTLRQFSPEGQLLKTLGQAGIAGGDESRFRSPDDVVFDSKGRMYVADAGNARIVQLDADGKFLSSWGKKGKQDGEFALAHSMTIDAQDRIYVGDRGNHRVQVFDTAGKHLASLTGVGNPFGVFSWGKELVVADGEVHKLTLVDAAGKVLGKWGGPEVLKLPHLMARDSQGLLYVAEVDGKRVQKLARKQ